MSDNVRFHSKWHGKNHHTKNTSGYYDSADDPIASQADPFMGNFYLSGALHLYQPDYMSGTSMVGAAISAGTWLGVESLYSTAVANSATWGVNTAMYTSVNATSGIWQPVGAGGAGGHSTQTEIYTLSSVCIGATDFAGDNWKFKVKGDAVIEGSLSATGGTTYLNTIVSEVSALEVSAATKSGGAPALKVTQSGAANCATFTGGSVGIGTETPDFTLEVARTGGGNVCHFASTSTSAGIQLSANNKTWDLFNSNGISNQGFGVYDRTNTVYRLAIDGSSGNVGIGTTAPEDALTVVGNISASGALSACGKSVFHGEVGIGTGSAVLARLHVRGNSDTSADDCAIRIVDADGTSGSITPNLQFRSDSAQIYKIHANDQLGLTFRNSSDANKITFDDNGNVGIGTTTPKEALTVVGNISASGALSACSTGDNFFQGNVGIEGNVGIGTITPGTELEVGDGTGNEAITINKSTGGTGTLYFDNAGSNKVYFQADADEHLRIATNNSVAMSILENGNVGIGTSSPLRALHVAADATPAIGISVLDSTITDTQNIGAIYFGGSEDSGSNWDHGAVIAAYAAEDWTVGSAAGTDLTFWTIPKTTSNAVERMRILDDGKVGIGTTAPDAVLSVRQDESATKTHFTQAVDKAGILISTDYTADAYTPGVFWNTDDANSDKPKAGIFLQETGSGTYMHLGVSNAYATGITNECYIHYSGAFHSPNDIVAYSSSDERLKHDITKIGGALDKVTKLSGYTFKWNTDLHRPIESYNEVEAGVIAQEVQEVLPEAVKERSDGHLAVKYEQLIPLLIESIKELKEDNDNIKSELEDLKRKR